MSSSTLASRYAAALIDIAHDHDLLEQFAGELTRIGQLFRSPDFSELFRNPQISIESRRKVLDELLEKISVSPICRNFCRLLNDRRRISLLPEIEQQYRRMSDAAANRVRAEVVVAESLSDVELTRIRLSLQGATGKEVVVEQKLEPAIIGGVITRLDGKVYDGSIKTQLSSLKRALAS